MGEQFMVQISFGFKKDTRWSVKRVIIGTVSECWRFYAVSTARVIFTAKTSLDVFSLSREQVWTFSSLG